MISAFPPRASPSSQLFAFLSRQHVERLATTNLGQELSPESMAKICSPVQALREAHVDPLPSFQASGLMSLCEPLRARGLSLCGTPSPGYCRTQTSLLWHGWQHAHSWVFLLPRQFWEQLTVLLWLLWPVEDGACPPWVTHGPDVYTCGPWPWPGLRAADCTSDIIPEPSPPTPSEWTGSILELKWTTVWPFPAHLPSQ